MSAMVFLSLFTMPIFALEQMKPAVVLITLIGAGLAALLLKPLWQPQFLQSPKGFVQCFGAMLTSNVIFLVGMIVGYMAVLGMGLEEPQSRNMAVLTALPTLALTGLMWWAALGLIIAKPTNKEPPRARTWTPEPPTHLSAQS